MDIARLRVVLEAHGADRVTDEVNKVRQAMERAGVAVEGYQGRLRFRVGGQFANETRAINAIGFAYAQITREGQAFEQLNRRLIQHLRVQGGHAQGTAVNVANLGRAWERLRFGVARAGVDVARGISYLDNKPVLGFAYVIMGLVRGTAALGTSMGAVTAGMAGVAAAAGLAAAALTAVALAIAAVIGLDYLAVKAAQTWGTYGDQLFVAQQKSRLTLEQLEILYVLAARTGTSFEHLTNTASRLQVSIGRALSNSASNAAAQIKALGISLEDLGKKSPTEQLHLVAKGLENQKNEAVRARAAQILLQRGWLEAATAIHELATNSEEATKIMKDLGLDMSQEEVDAAHEFTMKMRTLTLGMMAFGTMVGEHTAPAIEVGMDIIGQALGINGNNWRSWGDLVGKVLSAVVLTTVAAAKDIAASIKNIFNQAAGVGQYVLGVGETVSGFGGIEELLFPSLRGKTGLNRMRTGQEQFNKGFYNDEGLLTQKNMNEALKKYGEIQATIDARRKSGYTRPGGEFYDSEENKKKRGGGGRGKDPARIAEQLAKAEQDLAKTQLKNFEIRLQGEENALDHSLSQRYLSLRTWADQAEEIEIKRHDAVIKGLEVELEAAERMLTAAEKVRDPNRRKVDIVKAQAEIQKSNNEIEEENEKSSQKLRQIEQRRDREILQMAQQHRAALLSVREESNRNLIALDELAADIGITTFEAAASSRRKIRKKEYLEQRAELDKQIKEAGEDEAAVKRLEDEKRKLKVAYANDLREIELVEIESRKREVERLIKFGEESRRIYNDIANIVAETESLKIDAIDASGLHRNRVIKMRETEEIASARRTAQETVAAVRDQTRELEAEYRKQLEQARYLDREEVFLSGDNAKALLEQIRELGRQKVAVEENAQAKIKDIQRRAREEELEQWREISTQLSDILIDTFEGGWDSLLDHFKRILSQIERELLSSILMQVFKPGSPQMGSTTGGIIGTILNKIFKIGLPSGSKGEPKGEHGPAEGILDGLMTQNTGAIQNNTGALGSVTGQIATSVAQTAIDIVTNGMNTAMTGGNTASIIANTFSLDLLTYAIWNLAAQMTGGGDEEGGGTGSGIASLIAGLFSGGGDGGAGGLGAAALAGLGGGVTPLAGGINNVPYDNFPALLHKNEAVLTARENRNRGGGGDTYIINLPPRTKVSYTPPMSDRAQAESLASALRSRMRGSR